MSLRSLLCEVNACEIAENDLENRKRCKKIFGKKIKKIQKMTEKRVQSTCICLVLGRSLGNACRISVKPVIFKNTSGCIINLTISCIGPMTSQKNHPIRKATIDGATE